MKFNDLLFLNKMVTPFIITALYWLALVGVILAGLFLMYQGLFFRGLISIILGFVIVRLWSEFIILMFKIYGTLQVIAENTSKTTSNPVTQKETTIIPGDSSPLRSE